MSTRLRRFAKTTEMLFETCAQRRALRCRGAGFCQHDEIPRREISLDAERFASQPLESIAVHGALRNSTRDCQAEARVCASSRSRENGEESIGRSGGIGKDAAEFGRRMETLRGREPFPARQQRQAKTRPVTESSARGPWRVGWRAPYGRWRWPCGRETHECACGASCWAETFFSWRPTRNVKVLGKTKGSGAEEAANFTRRARAVSIRPLAFSLDHGLWITAAQWD